MGYLFNQKGEIKLLKCFLLLLCIFLLVGCSSSENPMPDIEEESQSESTVSEVEEPSTPEFSQDYSEFETIDDLVSSTINEFELNPDAVSVAYHNYQTQTDYAYNERESMLVGSTTKVGVARLYADLIAEGAMTFQTELPYSDSLYEPGAGRVTNGEKKATYPLYELFYY